MLPRRHDRDVNVMALVRDWLQRDDVAQWFMILDNADNVDILFPKGKYQDDTNEPLASFLPRAGNGKILVTSRSIDAAEKITGSGGGHPERSDNG